MEPDDWLPRGNRLANVSGGVLEAGQTDGIDPDANIFSLKFSKSHGSVLNKAQEGKSVVESICEATGSASVDVSAHSLGAIVAREYLRDPEEKVSGWVMMEAPRHSSPMVNVELFSRQTIGLVSDALMMGSHQRTPIPAAWSTTAETSWPTRRTSSPLARPPKDQQHRHEEGHDEEQRSGDPVR